MSNAIVVFTVFFGFGGTASIKLKRPSFDALPNNDNLVKYSYDYAIEDAASKVFMSRWEERRGDYTRGEYAMLEPEGRYIRTVGYQVDSRNGFDARVYTVIPGTFLLSTQQFKRSLELHPQPPLQLDPIPPDETANDLRTFNYHAMYHEKIGYHKMFQTPKYPTGSSDERLA